MNYSLFKSRTFWTIVFMFVFNGFVAISGSISPEWSVPINFLLTSLAGYFHLQTGQSTTGTN